MRKIIDIPDDILVDLKVLAAKSNMNLKSFIEKTLVKIVEHGTSKHIRKKGKGNKDDIG